MAERKDGEGIKQDAAGDLPTVESPPLSPAGASSEESSEVDAVVDIDATANTETSLAAEDEVVVAKATTSRARFHIPRRYQRRMTLAATLALVAGLSALFGGAISNGLSGRNRVDVASLAQRQAMQRSIDRLAKQVGDLKTKLAAATVARQSQVASVSAQTGSDITGSIPPARTEPVPLPRPAPRIAAPVSQPAIVHSWRILRARGGVVAVEGRDGIYEVVPGAVLPGLGPVQSIERRGGRWVVVTPKGLIVSMRNSGYFDDF